MPHKLINKTNHYYEIHGQGKPLILISGFGCDHSIWNEFIEKLSPHFQLLLFDNRGSGQTQDDPDPLTLDLLAQDVIELSNSLEIQKPHIIGHSMGGSIALSLAALYTDFPDKMIVFNSSAKYSSISGVALSNIINLQKAQVDIDIIIDCFLPWGFSNEFLANPTTISNYKKIVKGYPFPQTTEGNERQLKALLAYDLRHKLNQITTKTLIVGSKSDLLVSEEDVQLIANAIPSAELVILPGSHMRLVEKMDETINLILNWL